MLVESLIAFALITLVTSLVYVLGRRASPKHAQSENALATYACGEQAPIQKQRIAVTLSKYLIFFVVLDSSVLLLAFATLATQGVNVPLMLLYLGIMLASSMLLLDGAADQ